MTLKRRIIPVVLFRGNEVVKGVEFDSWRSIGHVKQAMRVYRQRMVDELILLDIGATPTGKMPDYAMIRGLTEGCFFPVTVGGGVKNISQATGLLENGADKVAMCTYALERPKLISQCAKKFGSQSVVISVDVRAGRIMTHCGRIQTAWSAVDWAKEVENRGAGEILLNSIPLDGTLNGYDLDLINEVSHAVQIPVVAMGGAGTVEDFKDAINVGAHGVAAGAMFAWTETTPHLAAQHLHKQGVPVRYERGM